MSRKSYNLYGVPWYSPSDTPAIRGGPNEGEPQSVNPRYAAGQASRMRAYQHMRDQIRANWQPGTRFLFPRREDIKEGPFSGEYVSLQQRGAYWSVTVKLDAGQKKKGGPYFGMVLFYAFAEKEIAGPAEGAD
jgi:hypothetical protein